MVIGVKTHQPALWSEQALERLAKDELPPTPQNYSFYYNYFSSGVKDLNTAYDHIVGTRKITQKDCDDLYVRYLVPDTEASFYKDANSIIDSELKKVLDLITTSAKGTDQFGENLESFSGKLTGAGSIETLREAVTKISEETKAIAVQNQKLQNELAATTEQLGEMRDNFNQAHRESQIDALTEVGNRKFFDHEIARTIAEVHEQKSTLSLLMIDIDHFKQFNDTHGHLVGDQVLRLVARTLVENLKGRDVIARYGGEEFVILLPQTRAQDAERVANQLRLSLASKKITKRNTNEVLGIITISIGIAEYLTSEDSETLVSRADKALYKAKQSGRNKAVCA